MPLSPGDRLGVYEILAVLGEGGMGRVYRARDPKLQRDVAVKVLPDNVAGDSERVARFEREARTLAALNHPHAVPVTARPFSVGTPQTLFGAPNLIGFDISADGKRIVAVQQGESMENPHLVLVNGWFEELKAMMRPAR